MGLQASLCLRIVSLTALQVYINRLSAVSPNSQILRSHMFIKNFFNDLGVSAVYISSLLLTQISDKCVMGRGEQLQISNCANISVVHIFQLGRTTTNKLYIQVRPSPPSTSEFCFTLKQLTKDIEDSRQRGKGTIHAVLKNYQIM